MKIDVEENLINPPERTNSISIDNEIENLLDTDEGQNIRSDIELLKEMGFNKKMINKVYILLRPANIQNAIEFMIEINNKYQHNFMQSSNPEEKYLCLICKKPKENHMNYNQNEELSDEQNISLIKNTENIIIEKDNDNENNNDELECEVCYEIISSEDKEFNKINCGHLFCVHCWFNYLKTLIMEGKVDKIKCMDHECNEIISKEFILKHICEHNILIDKYNRFIERNEVFNNKNKRYCPKPDCDSYLEKNELTKYVKCKNGHEYCFECLKLPHGNKKCDTGQEKNLLKWMKSKKVKRCPRCQIYTEKNKGCNHMTCINCQYQWCWLCEGEYKYGHYKRGNCGGLQFAEYNNFDEILKLKNIFGLHKLFSCICPEIENPFLLQNNIGCSKFFVVVMTIFYTGVLYFNIFYLIKNFFKLLKRPSENNKKKNYWIFFSSTFSLCLWISFQLSFIIIIIPFLFISIFFHHEWIYMFMYLITFGEYY